MYISPLPFFPSLSFCHSYIDVKEGELQVYKFYNFKDERIIVKKKEKNPNKDNKSDGYRVNKTSMKMVYNY